MTEEATLEAQAFSVKKKIKSALLDRDMSQVELSQLIKENAQQVNRAIAGDMTPKSKEIRNKIYRVLNL